MSSRMGKFIQKLLQKLLINITFKIKKVLRNEWMGMQHSRKHIVLPKSSYPKKMKYIRERSHKIIDRFHIETEFKNKNMYPIFLLKDMKKERLLQNTLLTRISFRFVSIGNSWYSNLGWKYWNILRSDREINEGAEI